LVIFKPLVSPTFDHNPLIPRIMKTTVFILSLALVLQACKKKDKDQPNDPTPVTTTGGSTTSGSTQTSIATVSLTSGTKTTTITGSCLWSNSSVGRRYITSQDQNKSLRVLHIPFNIPALPAQTTTYSLVPYDANDTDPTHIFMSFTEQIGSGYLSWYSTSGSLTLVVAGNKVTANLAGITLEADTVQSGFTNLNVGEYAKPGALSGNLTLYK
jgi:hypothetical protein